MPHVAPLSNRSIPAPEDGFAFLRGLPAALPPSLALWAAAVWPAPGAPR